MTRGREAFAVTRQAWAAVGWRYAVWDRLDGVVHLAGGGVPGRRDVAHASRLDAPADGAQSVLRGCRTGDPGDARGVFHAAAAPGRGGARHGGGVIVSIVLYLRG